MGMMSRKVMAGASGEVDITSPFHPDLALYYTMDNISGSTLVDESPNGNDGTLSNTGTTTGVIGNAITTTGLSGSYVNIPNVLTAQSTGAISGWSKRNASGTTWFFSHTNTGNNLPTTLCFIDGTTGKFRILWNNSGSDGFLEGDTVISTGAFAHIVMQNNDGVENEVYIDNVKQTLTPIIGSNTGFWFNDKSAGTYSVDFGRLNRPAMEFSPITNDLFRVFNRPLIVGEIATLYNGGSGA